MPCSSSSPLLDEYVDGTLSAQSRAAVEAHVEDCAECSHVLAELRVVDALLLTPRTVDLSENFTFKVMAEVRSLPPAHAKRTPVVRVLATYLAYAWAAIAAWIVFVPSSAHAAVGLVRDVVAQYASAGTTIGEMVTQALGHRLFGVTASLGGILALDFFAAAAAGSAYVFLRPRLAAALAGAPEGR